MTEELQTQQQPQPATVQQAQPKQRLGPQDYRNSELVTKLMAANPPYLYSPAVGPHNFFFSEMLRSLVANKRNESLRSASEQLHHHHQQQQQQQQQQHHQQQQTAPLSSHLQSNLALQAATVRRPRKRSWSQHRYYPELLKDGGKDSEEKRSTHPEKPLELTNKLSAFSRSIGSSASTSSVQKYSEGEGLQERFKAHATYHERKPDEPPKSSAGPDKSTMNNANLIPEPPTGSMPPSDLILPPPPPVWYPPLYPPYGIDPLHFFIDLRVSGHIYDRKKDSNSPGGPEQETGLSVKREHSKLIGTGNDRQGSAFSVPKPRDSTALGGKPGSAIDLVAPLEEAGTTPSNEAAEGSDTGDLQPGAMGSLFAGDFPDHKMDAIKNTNYVLQNLPRIYGDLNGNHKVADRAYTADDDMNGNLSDEHEHDQDSKSVESVEELVGDDSKYKDIDLNVISDEESIAVDEN